jgi:hypothetical protein
VIAGYALMLRPGDCSSCDTCPRPPPPCQPHCTPGPMPGPMPPQAVVTSATFKNLKPVETEVPRLQFQAGGASRKRVRRGRFWSHPIYEQRQVSRLPRHLCPPCSTGDCRATTSTDCGGYYPFAFIPFVAGEWLKSWSEISRHTHKYPKKIGYR